MSKSIDGQLAAIKSIMRKTLSEHVPVYTFNFGKHKGKSLLEVFNLDKPYLEWLYENTDRLSTEIEMFIVNNVIRK